MTWASKTESDYEVDPFLVVDFASNRQYLLGWIIGSICAASVLAVPAVSSIRLCRVHPLVFVDFGCLFFADVQGIRLKIVGLAQQSVSFDPL